MPEQNMAGRLARIMGDVGRVEKKGRITSQGSGPNYKFARDSDVLEAVGPPLAEAGIVMVPEHTDLLSIEPNMRGTQLIANIKTSWHVTDGKESLRFETLGQGQDSGDKALPKAQSNARKYAFFMLFHIVTGDDPDHYASTEQPEREARGGERPSGQAPSSPSGAPAPAPRTKGAALSLIADAAKAHGLSFGQIEEKAKELGINRGEASIEDLMRLWGAIEQPSSVPAPAGAAGVAPSASAATTPPSEGSPDSSGSDAATTQRSGVEAVSPGTPPDPASAQTLLDEAVRIAEAPAEVPA